MLKENDLIDQDKKKYLKYFNLLEIINFSYICILTVLILIILIFKHNATVWPGIILYAILNSVILLIVYCKYTGLIKSTYYNIVYLFFIPPIFDSMQYIVPNLFTNADAFLTKADKIIMFGFNPTRYIQGNISQNALFNTILMICYMIYFFLPAVIFITHALQKQKDIIIRDILYITLGLYLCYLGYILLPAVGPRFYFNYEYDLAGGSFFHYASNLINTLENNKLDVFPSAHTQMGLVATYLVRKNKILFPLFCLEFTGIFLSTICLRFHYITDIIAGVIFFFITLWLAKHLEFWYRNRF